MTKEALFEACITAVRAWPDARTVDEGDRLLKLYKDTKAEILVRLASRLDDADALRKENEELKAQNLLIRGDNADLLAKADAYSFNLSNMNASIVELRKDNDHNKYYEAYHELKDAAISLVQRLELDKDVKKNNWWLNERAKIMEVVSKESEASHE
jgi:hypothetical protein